MPGDGTRPYEEWHHDSALPGEPGGWDTPQELEPPPEWYGGGTFVPGNDDRPAWGDPYQDQPAQDDPYEPAPYRPSSHRRSRRSARRSIAVTALLLAAFAAGTGAALVHNGTIKLSPAANPEANATSGLGAATGAGHGSTGTHSGAEQPPAITKADAERVVSHYLQVNNEANASYSDSLLGTIESGSSYTMDAGSYRFALGAVRPYPVRSLRADRHQVLHPPPAPDQLPALVRRPRLLRHHVGRQEPRLGVPRVRPGLCWRALERRRRTGHPARSGTAADSNRFWRVRGERGR